MSASNGAPRSLQHEHSNAVELQNTQFQENVYRMQTQTHLGLHFRGILATTYIIHHTCYLIHAICCKLAVQNVMG